MREYILIFCVCRVRRMVVKITDARRMQALRYRYRLGDDPQDPTLQ